MKNLISIFLIMTSFNLLAPPPSQRTDPQKNNQPPRPKASHGQRPQQPISVRLNPATEKPLTQHNN